MKIKKIISIILLVSILFSFEKEVNVNIPTNAFITDDEGNVFIYLNIIGHVKSPGSYLVHEEANLLTILSQAGGPLPGAKLNDIIIYSEESMRLNLNDYIAINQSGDNSSILKFKPNDTIYLKQKFTSSFFTNSNLMYTFLQILNIALTIENNK